ncbi:MAG: hypothetical protein QW548_02675 [Candidatus Aenigmatarchaeota archaeon]
MAHGLLAETDEEQKYPKWFRYLGAAYVIVLLWALFAAPAAFSDMLVSLLMLSPALVAMSYIFEKPYRVTRHPKAMRIAFGVLAINAMFWGIALAYAFMG